MDHASIQFARDVELAVHQGVGLGEAVALTRAERNTSFVQTGITIIGYMATILGAIGMVTPARPQSSAPQGASRKPHEPPPNLTPDGAGRRGAFNKAKENSGVPRSMQPHETGPNYDRQNRVRPGRAYHYLIPKPEGGFRKVTIRDDSRGHYYGPNNPQNRGRHFNDPNDGHYDY